MDKSMRACASVLRQAAGRGGGAARWRAAAPRGGGV